MSDPDVLKILIASDMHLGYAEKDPIRGDDSFNTFEELFIKANEHQVRTPCISSGDPRAAPLPGQSLAPRTVGGLPHYGGTTRAATHRTPCRAQVDMVLFAGDLFHDNKPSRKSLQKCMETLRDHVLGSREVNIEVVSDQNANFHDKYRQVNYEDANYNVQVSPVCGSPSRLPSRPSQCRIRVMHHSRRDPSPRLVESPQSNITPSFAVLRACRVRGMHHWVNPRYSGTPVAQPHE